MTPPEAPDRKDGSAPPAVSFRASAPRLSVLRKRKDFLAAARARRQGTRGLMLQARQRGDEDPTIRVGFTCSKKVGNAVARNRAKRRLREVARRVLPELGQAGWDYVLIGRPADTAARPFPDLLADLERALGQIHGTRPHKAPPAPGQAV